MRGHGAGRVVVVVILVASVSAACSRDEQAVGVRAAPGGRVEAFYRSCDASPVTLALLESFAPVSRPGNGTVSLPSGYDTVWEGTGSGDETGTVVPYEVRSGYLYSLAAQTSRSGTSTTFVGGDLDDRVLQIGTYPATETQEVAQWEGDAASLCDDELAPMRAAIALVVVVGLAAIVLLALVIHAVRRRRPVRSPSGLPSPPP